MATIVAAACAADVSELATDAGDAIADAGRLLEDAGRALSDAGSSVVDAGKDAAQAQAPSVLEAECKALKTNSSSGTVISSEWFATFEAKMESVRGSWSCDHPRPACIAPGCVSTMPATDCQTTYALASDDLVLVWCGAQFAGDRTHGTFARLIVD